MLHSEKVAAGNLVRGCLRGVFPPFSFSTFGDSIMKLIQKIGVVGTALFGVVVNAHAALPAEATAAFTALSGNVTDTIAAVWPVLVLSVGGFAVMKLFKKGANKAV